MIFKLINFNAYAIGNLINKNKFKINMLNYKNKLLLLFKILLIEVVFNVNVIHPFFKNLYIKT